MALRPNNSPQTRDLLAVMLRKRRTWHYGYELSRDTGLSSGTLYPLLIRLSDQGLLESHWYRTRNAPGKPPPPRIQADLGGIGPCTRDSGAGEASRRSKRGCGSDNMIEGPSFPRRMALVLMEHAARVLPSARDDHTRLDGANLVSLYRPAGSRRSASGRYGTCRVLSTRRWWWWKRIG